jgi:Dolichyl-phosphate-mannose-protein mannosyltransferase
MTSMPSEPRRITALIRKWAPATLLVVVPVLLVSLHVRAYTKLSPIDELQHIDYMFRSPGVHQVVAGTRDSGPAMREEVCRGIDDAVIPLPPCSSKKLVPSQFQDQGYDTAYIHPPTYYDVTWALGKVVKPLTGAKSWVTTWRLVGALWLAAGLLLTYAAGLRMDARPLPLVGLLVLLASAPSIIETNSTVTPDAASTFVGGAVLYLACRWRSGDRWRWLALVGIGFVATAFKLQGAIVVMMIVIYLLLSARGATPNDDKDSTTRNHPEPTPDPSGLIRHGSGPARLVQSVSVRAVAILVVTTGAIAGAWTVLQRVTETIDPNKLRVNRQFVVSSISLQQIASSFGAFLAPLPGAFIPTATRNVWTDDTLSLLSWLLVAGLVGGAIFLAHSHATASLARAALITALFGGPIFVLLNFVSMSQYIPIPSRYGFPLLPAMVVCTADAIRTRWAGICALGAGLLSVALVAYRMA